MRTNTFFVNKLGDLYEIRPRSKNKIKQFKTINCSIMFDIVYFSIEAFAYAVKRPWQSRLNEGVFNMLRIIKYHPKGALIKIRPQDLAEDQLPDP
jgi:hypothetical protein